MNRPVRVQNLKAPFPYFGGKQKVAGIVWERFGNPRNYVEPFAGSAAVLLRRPETGEIETVNDTNHYLVNAWRAIKNDPEQVAYHADNPVTEADLHARHRYLMFSQAAHEAMQSITTDPEYYDARLAGWWVWGMCCWIGGGWCTEYGARRSGTDSREQIPELRSCKGVLQVPDLSGDIGSFGRGVHASGGPKKMPDISGHFGAYGRGVVSSARHNKRPRLAAHDQSGTGVNRTGIPQKTPSLNSNYDRVGTDVNADTQLRRPSMQASKGVVSSGRPQLGDAYDIGRGVNANGRAGTCRQRKIWLRDWMCSLADRLRLVRVCYGHWSRVCDSDTTLTRLAGNGGHSAVFLDPPYCKDLDRLHALIAGEEAGQQTNSTNRAKTLYSNDNDQDVDRLVAEVNLWCQKWGANPRIMIALCGYEGEHNNLEALGWEKIHWKAQGGYGNRNVANQNNHRERIWFSPACKQPEGYLF